MDDEIQEELPPVCENCSRPFTSPYRRQCSECSRCRRCCACTRCQGCGEIDDDLCGDCDYCNNCCDCRTCNECNCRVGSDDFCDGCDRCNDCCSCHDEEGGVTIEYIHRGLRWFAASRKDLVRNPVKRFISTEIEVAGAHNTSAIERVAEQWHCSIVEDGSLPSNGFEINTSPAQGDVFLRQIADFGDALSSGESFIRNCCGLHVHIDARDFRYWDIRRLIYLYVKIEEGLFDIVAPSRRGCSCCRPCAQTYLQHIRTAKKPSEFKNGILTGLYGNKKQARYSKREKYCHCRYAALNLHSWMHRGTVEFRMGSGTINPKKIGCWSMLLAGVIDYVSKHSDKDIAALTQSPLTILKALSPTEEVRKWVQDRYDLFSPKRSAYPTQTNSRNAW